MKRTEMLKAAEEYKEAVKNIELKKQPSMVYEIFGSSGEITVEYNPENDSLDIKYGGNKLRLPGISIHSLNIIFEKLDG